MGTTRCAASRCCVELDDAGGVSRARAAYLSVAGTPLVLDLTDAAGDPAAAGRLARDRVSPAGDIHATAAYRRHLAGVLTERALADAIAAREGAVRWLAPSCSASG